MLDTSSRKKNRMAPLVLLYHRIADKGIDNQFLSVSPENFEEHLLCLKSLGKVVPLWDLIQAAQHDHFPECHFAITFDDGYADNFLAALPLLEKYQCPATIFVSSGIVGSSRGFWGDIFEAAFLGAHSLPEEVNLAEWGTFSLRTPEERLHAHDTLRAILKEKHTFQEIWQFIDTLLPKLGLQKNLNTHHHALTKEQLLQLADSPMIEIGAHCVTHPWLSTLPVQQQHWEIAESTQQLASLLKKDIRLFAYPYGSPASFGDSAAEMVRNLGLIGIANFQGELRPPLDPARIPRRLVRNWDSQYFKKWLRADAATKTRLERQTLATRKESILEKMEQHTQPRTTPPKCKAQFPAIPTSLSITFINTQDSRGGAANSTRLMAHTLAARGHAIQTLVGKNTISPSHARAFPVSPNEKRHTQAMSEGLLDYALQGSHALVNHPAVLQADLLHFQNLHGGFFNPFSISLLSRLKPTVWTLRDMWALTGHCAHAMKCQRWKSGCGKCPDLTTYPSIPVDSSAKIWADKKRIYEHSRLWITCPSEWLTRKVQQSMLGIHPVRTIMNAIDTNIYRPQGKNIARKALGLPEDAVIMGMAADSGLKNPYKGGQYALEALKVLSRMFPKLYFFSIGGDVAPDIPNLLTLPYISRPQDMATYYSCLDFLLFTSLADTCPLALLESLACGTPVVGFATGGAPEIVRDGTDGIMTPPEDMDALLKAAITIIKSPEQRRIMGEQAAKDAAQRFSLERLGQDYEQLYEEILRSPSKIPSSIALNELPTIINTSAYRAAEQDVATHIGKNTNYSQYKKQLEELPAATTPETAWRVSPASRIFGLELGRSLCRYYLEKFLFKNRKHISGHVLEIGDASYTKRYGGKKVEQSAVLNAFPSPNATIVGDLASGKNIPVNMFDCIILTQTLQCIYDCKSALQHAYAALRTGGILLVSVPSISPISRYDMNRWGEFWRFTDKGLSHMLKETCPEASISIECWGNAAAAKGYLDGLPAESLPPDVLDVQDNDYQMVLTAVVKK